MLLKDSSWKLFFFTSTLGCRSSSGRLQVVAANKDSARREDASPGQIIGGHIGGLNLVQLKDLFCHYANMMS